MVDRLSQIYEGTLFHKRFGPTAHQFTYPVYTFAVDLTQLPTLGSACVGFGYNRFSVLSIWAKDYLDGGESDLYLRAKTFISTYHSQTLSDRVTRLVLVTSPRFLNYVFNPVSFFYGYDADHQLVMVLAEVHNTFGETHVYILDDPINKPSHKIGFKIDKRFHVSPFFDRKGHYEFLFSPLADQVSIQITLKENDAPKLVATLTGKALPMTTKSIWKMILGYPFAIALTMPRIIYQSMILFFLKKLPVYQKPIADDVMTISKQKPSLIKKLIHSFIIEKGIISFFKKLKHGCLEVTFPEGQTHVFGEPSGPKYTLTIKDHTFFKRMALYGEIGVGESYMAGEWDTPDLTRLLGFFVDNIQQLNDSPLLLQKIFGKYNDFVHQARENSIQNSKANISQHYDLSNDLFKLFLDDTMTYSSGLFLSKTDTLLQSQLNKIHGLIDKAKINESHHVLEIGCGWGAFAIEAVKKTGCRVTGLTLSQDQYDIAVERVKEAGLSDKITILLCDYRTMTGQFDRIVSIEMLEAVGHQYLPTYFQKCDQLLKHDGIIVIQSITIPDHRYDGYKKEADWIQKHIFPGGHLPCLFKISEVLTEHTTLLIDNAENIGPHYAPTLAIWRESFYAQKDQILALGFTEEFIRKWVYYFSYCETGFRKRYLGNYQLVLTRIGNLQLSPPSTL